LTSVYFLSPSTGWIVDDFGEVFKTTNGGSSWNYIKIGFPGFSIYFVSPSLGWIGASGLILKSTDGGLNWTYSSSGSNYILFDICFKTPLLGYIVG
jgi:photosystem II stability/assembly factor-like uncharacterized protein